MGGWTRPTTPRGRHEIALIGLIDVRNRERCPAARLDDLPSRPVAARDRSSHMDAATILGGDFAGALTRDGWAPNRRLVHADHQTCLAHLRRCRLLQIDRPRSPFTVRVQQRLQQALTSSERYAAGKVRLTRYTKTAYLAFTSLTRFFNAGESPLSSWAPAGAPFACSR